MCNIPSEGVLTIVEKLGQKQTLFSMEKSTGHRVLRVLF